MKKIMKMMALVLGAGMILASPAAAEESSYEIIDQEYKIAWIGWGNTDPVGKAIHAYCEYLDEQMPEISFVYSDAGLRGNDAVVADAEAFCQSGVQAIIAYIPSAALADVCSKYGVWLGAGTNIVTDQELIDYLDNCDIWLGYCPHGDNVQEGYDSAKTLYDLGARNFVAVGLDPGQPANDLRYEGIAKFIDETDDAKLVGEFRGEDGVQGLSDLLALYGNEIDAVCKTSASNKHNLEGAVAALASAGVDALISCTDRSDSAGMLFEEGMLGFCNAGDQVDAGLMVVPALNALTGNYEGPVYLYPPYIQMRSVEDCEGYTKWVDGDLPPFTADELRAYIKVYNPEATNESYKAYVESEFNLESIAARHEGLAE